MPTVLRVGPFEITVYVRDHMPPHVHVFAQGGEAIILLNCKKDEPEIREFYRSKKSMLRRALSVVSLHQAELCVHWQEIHGYI